MLQSQMAEALVSKPQFVYLTVLPGVLWPLALAWFYSAWQARRHPGSSPEAGWVTAVPLGYSLASSVLLGVGLLGPIFRQGVAQGHPVEQAGSLAWSAAVAITLVVGLCQILLAPFSHRLVRGLSLPMCLALGAALAGLSIAVRLPWLVQHPLMALGGLIPIVAFLVVGLPRPFGLSLGWIVFATGLGAQIASGTRFELPDLSGSLLPNWQIGWIEDGLRYLWLQPEFLSVAVPLLTATVVRDLVLLREAQSQPNYPSARATLLGLGLLNVVGACLGCGLPLGVLPGFLGYRRWGAGQFYAQGGGLLLASVGLLGGVGSVFGWLPLPTMGLILVSQLLVSAAASVNLVGAQHGYLLMACWLPFTASAGEGCALLVGLIWGGIAVTAQAGRMGTAAWVCLAGSLLTYTGLLHRNLWHPDFDPLAGAYLVTGILLRIGYVMRSEAAKATSPLAPLDPATPFDSSGNPDTSACDTPPDNLLVAGAEPLPAD
jgi:hypothetical protein